MNVIHLLSSGNIGGIETLCEDYAFCSSHWNCFVFLWNGGVITDEMRQNGINVIELHADKRNYLNAYKKVLDACNKQGADIVVAHHADPFLHYCLIQIKKDIPEIKTIAYAHSNASDMYITRRRWLKKLKKLVLKRSLHKVDQIVAISADVKKSLISCFHIPSSKISVIYNGINISIFSLANRERNKRLQLVYVGRLIEQKGVQITLQALAQLKDVNYQFTVVGDGPYRGKLERQAVELGIEERVEFLGSRRDVPQLLQQSGIFIHMPVWEEGFGITIIEAMASGLICICAKSGAIPEIIEDGKSGFLIAKDTANEYETKIREVMAMNKDEVQLISHQAVERAKHFSIECFAAQLDNLIADTCNVHS